MIRDTTRAAQAVVVGFPLMLCVCAPVLILLPLGAPLSVPAMVWVKVLAFNLAVLGGCYGIYLLAKRPKQGSTTFLGVHPAMWKWGPPVCYLAGTAVGLFHLVVSFL